MVKAPTIQQFRKSFGTFCMDIPGRWNGDAYRYHPHGFIMRPMLYTDHHHRDGFCDAQVITDPAAAIIHAAKGRDASIAGSGENAVPRVTSGELVTIYRCGEWVGPDGPWRAAMRRDMAAVLRMIRSAKRCAAAEASKAANAASDRRKQSYDRALAAFQSTAQ